jgi:DNA invertase Pin-like site-specific DNA recombinase
VIGGIGAPSPFLAAKGGILGDEDFVRRVTEQVPASITAASEIPRRERLAARPALAELYNPARNNKTARDEAARLAWRKYGYAMSEIARSFDVHYTTISKILRKK